MRFTGWIRVLAVALASAAPVAAQPAPPPEAPVRGFVYIEPFEIRAEFVVRLDGVDLGGDAPGTDLLNETAQVGLVDAFSSRLAEACSLRADGEPLSFELAEIRFIAIDPARGPMPDDRAAIPLDDARIAAVFSCARAGFPETIAFDWTLFPVGAPAASVPVEIEVMSGDEVHTEVLAVSPDDASRSWTLPDVQAPVLRTLAEVGRADVLAPILVASAFVLLGLGLAVFALRGARGERPGRFVAAALALALGGGAFAGLRGGVRGGDLDEAQARNIVDALLTNVYHAFAFRDESMIFDTLAASVEGPLLEELYLDIRRGLVVEEEGGPRVKVLSVSLVDCDVQRVRSGGGMTARVIWVSAGNVSHLGHVHRRRNQYRGELRIEPVDGRWKVTGVTILEEERT